MTGEITLRGKVLPVGGIKDKILAAYRAGIRTIILSAENDKDLDDLPEEIRGQMEFHLVNTMDEVIKIAMEGPRPAPGRRGARRQACRGRRGRQLGGWEFEIMGTVRSRNSSDSRSGSRTLLPNAPAHSADTSHSKRTETMARRKGPSDSDVETLEPPPEGLPDTTGEEARARRARRHARHPRAPRDQDPAAPEDRQGPRGRERDRHAQAGPDLQDPAGADREERPDLRRGRARDACPTASASCARPSTTTCPGPTTSTSRPRRSASSTCAPATRSPARSGRRRKASATSPSSRSRRSTSSTPTSRARRSSSTT